MPRFVPEGVSEGSLATNLDSFLLSLDDAVFVRASEAAEVDPTNGFGFYGDWAAVNVLRVVRSGTVFIEPTRTNIIVESEDLSTWTVSGSPTLVGGNLAPDGELDAYTIEDSSMVTFEAITRAVTVANGVQLCGSVYILQDDVTTRFPAYGLIATTVGRLYLNTEDGDVVGSGASLDFDPAVGDGAWWSFRGRYTTAGTALTAVIHPAIGVVIGVNSVTAVGTIRCWGVQVEEDAPFSTSYIRTSGAAATRAKDDLRFPAGWGAGTSLLDGAFKFRWTPIFNSSDDVTPGRVYSLLGIDGTNLLRVRFTGATWDVEFGNSAGTSSLTLSGLSSAWSILDELEFTIDHVTGSVSVSINGGPPQSNTGAAAGGSWSNATSLFYGQDQLANNQCAGLITLPEAA